MHIEFISSLFSPDQFGGASLRCHAIESIYRKLGFSFNTTYQQDITTSKNMKTYAKVLKYGRAVQDLFLTARLELPEHDFLHLDRLRYFNYDFIPSDRPIIYNAHNLEFEIYFDRTQKRLSEKFLSYELEKVEQAMHTFVCSDRERDILLGADPKLENKVSVIPNLVERDNYQFSPSKKVISFVGTLDYYPNIQAVRYLCNDFFPKIEDSLFSDFDFIVAGRNPTPEIEDLLANSKVKLLKNLSNEQMRQLISDTYISLVPLFGGSGSRLKIVESIFSRAKVLSTPLGAEGISSEAITLAPIEQFLEAFNKLILEERDYKWDEIIEQFSREHDLNTWYALNENRLRQIFKL